MTDHDWLACTDPAQMLGFLRDQNMLTERKSRLFGVAVCHRVWHLLSDERSRRAVSVAERSADSEATKEELTAAFESAFDVGAALAERNDKSCDRLRCAAWAASEASHPDELAEGVALEASKASGEESECQRQVDLLGEIFGNSFCPIAISSNWFSPTVMSLAQAIYEERAFDRLPILADALEDGGCNNQDILEHCRSGGEHVRGCWVVDLVLGKK